MSLASRRRTRSDASIDDAKGSIVGLSGWLFADLLLALAVVFLVASDRPVGSASAVGDSSDKYDIAVEFALSPSGDAQTQVDQIDRTFDIWVRFSEPVDPRSFKELQLEPKDQWSYRFVDKLDVGQQKVFQIRLNPERVTGSSLLITVDQRAVRHSERENSFNSKATLTVAITVCKSLAGIAVDPGETARFLLPGGANMSATQIAEWLSNSARQNDPPHPRGSGNQGYGTASRVYEEIVKSQAIRRQIGFAILFGGYDSNIESADDGVRRARNKVESVREALRSLGLLPKPVSSGSTSCPLAAEVPVRPFGNSSVRSSDLQFELYFYNLES